MSYLIAYRNPKYYTMFFRGNENDWEFGDLDMARRFETKRSTSKFTDKLKSGIVVVTLEQAMDVVQRERSEKLTTDTLHSKWCPNSHPATENGQCRFLRDLKSMVKK